MDARWKAALIHPFHVNVVEAHRDLNLRTFSVEVADDRVVRSLYQRSVGYTYEAVKIFMPAGGSNRFTRRTASKSRLTRLRQAYGCGTAAKTSDGTNRATNTPAPAAVEALTMASLKKE
jgi:hypothetical protein